MEAYFVGGWVYERSHGGLGDAPGASIGRAGPMTTEETGIAMDFGPVKLGDLRGGAVVLRYPHALQEVEGRQGR